MDEIVAEDTDLFARYGVAGGDVGDARNIRHLIPGPAKGLEGGRDANAIFSVTFDHHRNDFPVWVPSDGNPLTEVQQRNLFRLPSDSHVQGQWPSETDARTEVQSIVVASYRDSNRLDWNGIPGAAQAPEGSGDYRHGAGVFDHDRDGFVPHVEVNLAGVTEGQWKDFFRLSTDPNVSRDLGRKGDVCAETDTGQIAPDHTDCWSGGRRGGDSNGAEVRVEVWRRLTTAEVRYGVGTVPMELD